MNIVKKTSDRGSGYNVASKAFVSRWGVSMGIPSVESWMLADASTPSPNLRASELFLQLAIATQYREENLVSFMGYGGTLGEYRHLWSVQVADDFEWREFYSPHMRNIGKISGDFAPAKLLGDVHHERASLLKRLGPVLGISSVGEVLPLEDTFNISLTNLSWYGDHALGKVPCPDCSNQRGQVIYHPVRVSAGSYVLCRNEHATNVCGCKGAKAWRERNAWEFPLSKLERLLGFRLSGKAVYELLCSSPLARNSALLIRDYSASRGTVEQIIAHYPTHQVGITTALNIKRGDSDATGHDLNVAIAEQPGDRFISGAFFRTF